jgi:hypothetical protein
MKEQKRKRGGAYKKNLLKLKKFIKEQHSDNEADIKKETKSENGNK